jgi:hypothetical protein
MTKETTMKRLPHKILVGAYLLLAGCAAQVPTDPGAFDVKPDQLAHLRRGQAVSLVNGYPGEAKVSVRVFSENHHRGMGTWVLDQQQLTETAIIMLTRALEKQEIQARDQAEKTITLRLRPVEAKMWRPPFSPIIRWTAILALEARFGDGSTTSIEVQNDSPAGGQRVFDGAVLFTLNDLLKDEKFVAYMNR